jgi:hypothetical protein
VDGVPHSLTGFERRFVYGDTASNASADGTAPREKGGDPRLQFGLCKAAMCSGLITPWVFRADSLDLQLDRATRLALALPRWIRFDEASSTFMASNRFFDRGIRPRGRAVAPGSCHAQKYGPSKLQKAIKKQKLTRPSMFFEPDWEAEPVRTIPRRNCLVRPRTRRARADLQPVREQRIAACTKPPATAGRSPLHPCSRRCYVGAPTYEVRIGRERSRGSAVAEGERELVILGGGITGLGIARLAARAGWPVTLVERDDLASGASSATSHMLHGGLRYLEHGAILAHPPGPLRAHGRLAHGPHARAPGALSWCPLRRGDRVGPWRLRAGLALYDMLSGPSGPSRHLVADARQLVRSSPASSPRDCEGRACMAT